MIRKVNIYDMDGTIVCSLHRYRTIQTERGEVIDLEHWREFQHLAWNDSLLPLAQQYKEDLLNPETYVIIATARVLARADMDFIRMRLGMPNHIISRKPESTVSGGVLKRKGLARFFNLKNFRGAEFTFYEDNVAYLKTVCDRFGIKGVYISSKQGH